MSSNNNPPSSTNTISENPGKLQRDYVTEMLLQREEFLMIGLTGRIGSGCTEASKILGATFSKLALPAMSPGARGFLSDDERDLRILYQYAQHHWLPFDVIKVRSIITSFALCNFDEFFKDIEAATNTFTNTAANTPTNNSTGNTPSPMHLFFSETANFLNRNSASFASANLLAQYRKVSGIYSGCFHANKKSLIEEDIFNEEDIFKNEIKKLTEACKDALLPPDKKIGKDKNKPAENGVNPTGNRVKTVGDKEQATQNEKKATEDEGKPTKNEENLTQNKAEKAEEKPIVSALSNFFSELYQTAGLSSNYPKRTVLLENTDYLLNLIAASIAYACWEQGLLKNQAATGNVAQVASDNEVPSANDNESQTASDNKVPSATDNESQTASDNEAQADTDNKKKTGTDNKKETITEDDAQRTIIKNIGNTLGSWEKTTDLDFLKYICVHDLLPAISTVVHDHQFKNHGPEFTELYQRYGNMIRGCGEIKFGTSVDDIDLDVSKVVTIPKKINQFVKVLRHPFSRTFSKPTRIVIDSLKSIQEVTYLRDRYSAFYVYAISADEDIRTKRLANNKNLSPAQISAIDWNEYSDRGAHIYHDYCLKHSDAESSSKSEDITESERAFMKSLLPPNNSSSEKPDHSVDIVRKKAYDSNVYQFVLQNVGSCIENADVYISNNYSEDTVERMGQPLTWAIVRNICLSYYPGLLCPTPIERCMQTAFIAKANSGCLSRQVGAVVTDSHYNILSLGWNDVPCGDITCRRKNLLDLHRLFDKQAYSNYELQNPDFRKRIARIYADTINCTNQFFNGKLGDLLCGLPWCYCFKDAHADHKEPMRSRAMHGEEKALSHVQENAVGGCLFTTSSPCEMCSKNAKNHQIKKIYYIEPYPGISEEQYSNSGDPDNRAEHILFNGAIGRAYTQMYTPIMPHKDILKFMGIKVNG